MPSPPSLPPPHGPAADSGRPARILHVDDDELAVRAVRQMLLKLGHAVTSYTDARAAADAFAVAPAFYDLLVTDLVMPGYDGVALAAAVRSHRPGFPVIVLSGYSDDWTPGELAEKGIREFVSKPVDLNTLAGVLRRALE